MKSVLTHAILAVGGLALAYFAWIAVDEKDVPETAVEVFDCDPKGLTKLTFSNDKRTVKVVPAKDGDARFYRIYVDEKNPDVKVKKKEFVGSEDLDELLEDLNPLRAVRALGKVPKKEQKELDFKKDGPRLNVACKSGRIDLEFGGLAYGVPQRYARAKSDSKLYLFEDNLINQLKSAETSLMQRKMNRFEIKEVETLTVKGFGSSKKLLQRNRLVPRKAEWVDAQNPDRRNELFGNWLDRVDRLSAQKYLPKGAKPGSDEDSAGTGSTEPVVELVYTSPGNRKLGTLELVKAGENYYARSSATRNWVKVSKSVAQQVADDAREVVGASGAKTASNKKAS